MEGFKGGWITLCGTCVTGTNASGAALALSRAEPVTTFGKGWTFAPTLAECLDVLPYLPHAEWYVPAARAFGRWLARRTGMSVGGVVLVPPQFPGWLRRGLWAGALEDGVRLRVCDEAVAVRIVLVQTLLGEPGDRQASIHIPRAGKVPVEVRSDTPALRGATLVCLGSLHPQKAGTGAEEAAEERETELALSGASRLLGSASTPPVLLRRGRLLIVDDQRGGTLRTLVIGDAPGAEERVELSLGAHTGRLCLLHCFADVHDAGAAPFSFIPATVANGGTLCIDRIRGTVEIRRAQPEPVRPLREWSIGEMGPPSLL